MERNCTRDGISNKIENLATTCVKINEMRINCYHNIICTIRHIYDWKINKRGEYMKTFCVIDKSIEKPIFVKVFKAQPTNKFDYEIGNTVVITYVKKTDNGFYLVRDDCEFYLLSTTDKEISGCIQDKNNKENNNFRPCHDISNLKNNEYINFVGLLITKQIEGSGLTILTFVDYSVNHSLKVNINRYKYPSNMLFIVKAWDKMANIASECKSDMFYYVENIKVNLSINLITGNLSSNDFSKITRLENDDERVVKILQRKKSYYKPIQDKGGVKSDKKSSKILIDNSNLPSLSSVNLDNITTDGVYIIRVNFICHFPYHGITFKSCDGCRNLYDSKLIICKCGYEFAEKDQIFVVRILVKDDSENCVLICKNDIAKLFLLKKDKIYSIDSPILCKVSVVFKNNKKFLYLVSSEVFNV